ncbi:hypothetical protein TGFOU_219690 [Toxoplasma gondii FOU]|uniref:Uncharacterized protein n=2 Tax=Toxoplasma gondii TaxID=5811 RepID=A0A086L341_TOXGO|nr:hypothetical protein TGFOU_219690 [Toxoplasma gondii FOU]PUA88851.1 hypothetical protein TGBR9_219690 [Toxoplasma gondii TgCATBr9]
MDAGVFCLFLPSAAVARFAKDGGDEIRRQSLLQAYSLQCFFKSRVQAECCVRFGCGRSKTVSDTEMAKPNDLAGLEKALNKNDKIDLARTDTFVERAEELMNKQLPEKHEHNQETEKMVAFDRRNSSSMLDASKLSPVFFPRFSRASPFSKETVGERAKTVRGRRNSQAEIGAKRPSEERICSLSNDALQVQAYSKITSFAKKDQKGF